MTTAPREDRVCDACARRTWLLERLGGHLEAARSRLDTVLGLDDDALVRAVAGRSATRVRAESAAVAPDELAARRRAAGLESVCRCDPGYPAALRELDAPPAVLHVAGGLGRLRALLDEATVAIVGSRTPTAYGRERATALAGECARSGMAVVSGLARGIDGCAHAGALAAGGMTIAVLPGGADRPYPAAHRTLHARVVRDGVAVSELGPGVRPRAWAFPARNRIVAALGAMTVVVQATERSGALITARAAASLGRPVGAVPGSVTSELSLGPHGLLRDGARVIAGVEDVLGALDLGTGDVAGARNPAPRPRLPPAQAALWEAIAAGEVGDAAFARAGLDAGEGLAALSALELGGHVRRGAGGRYVPRV